MTQRLLLRLTPPILHLTIINIHSAYTSAQNTFENYLSDAKKFEQAQITLRDNRDCKINNQQLWQEYKKQRFASERNPGFDIYEHFAFTTASLQPHLT